MRISKIQIKNYKSFRDSGEIELLPGFNVIVGKNNAGKTALIEALSLQFKNKPCRSPETILYKGANFSADSIVTISIEFTRKEALTILKDSGQSLYVPILLKDRQIAAKQVRRILNQATIELEGDFTTGAFIPPAYIPVYVNRSDLQNEQILSCKFEIDPDLHISTSSSLESVSVAKLFPTILAKTSVKRVYLFRAERFNLGEYEFGQETELKPDASNLAQVLNTLETTNPATFNKLMQFVKIIFPDVKQITIPPLGSKKVHIVIWSIPPETEREDLAIPLQESGTGLGQVLAILYVTLTSTFSRTIIIDEPQSFLHPGAIRKLLTILKQDFPQHQYILTTHSSTVIASTDSQTFHHVRKEGYESIVETIHVQETQKLRASLHEIGVRLSDVFGAENILWVEGPVEEECFPLIIKEVVRQSLYSTQILAVQHTGDFNQRKKTRIDLIFSIYERLSGKQSLLPPAIGFIFDTEGLSDEQKQDIQRHALGNHVGFLPHRMYENYLLHPEAIAKILGEDDTGAERHVTQEDVSQWLDENKNNPKYFPNIEELSILDKTWQSEVHGARLLADLFKSLTDNRVAYDKTEHSSRLTKWLIQNDLQFLESLGDFLKNFL